MEDKIQEVLSIGNKYFNKNALDSREKKLLKDVYKYFSGQNITENCGQCYSEAYLYIVKLKSYKKMKQNFKLKEGKILMVIGHADVYTNQNLTDEAAISILKVNPKLISKFEVFPDDWEDLVKKSGNKSKKEKPAEDTGSTGNSDSGEAGDKAKNEGDKTEDELRSNYGKMTVPALQEFAANIELPSEEWGELTKKPLIEYLVDKTKKAE